MSFIIQSGSRRAFTRYIRASFTYHFRNRTMYIFMNTSYPPDYHELVSRLKRGAVKSSFFLIPSQIDKIKLEYCSRLLDSCNGRLIHDERTLGIRFDTMHSADLSSVDYRKITHIVNVLQADLAWLIWECNCIARRLDFLDEVAERYRQQAVRNGYSEDEVAEVENLLLEAHAHLRSWNIGILDRAEYLSRRAHALTQVVYSGIAQRDAANSLRLALTSAELAKSSQAIAIATSRDSALMRIIAAITVFFLPATFTATFFSTTFFDFQVGRHERVYSGWIWLYFLVTALLTVIVLIGTWILWKRKEDEIAAGFAKVKKVD
ncbi:hypothetical protein CC78DRAFT_277396 [Lojkania enalia]|uniref:Mg2+ transporter protein n=1 Tax=Lojkania enalia TaxID=147567 RepID=A0A9P4N9W5_9PLEO|nr:hypothetical protein CC78DRAFT_277396 [Didymosphaeria enalia]